MRAGVESGGERAFGYEFFFFAGHQGVEAGAIDGAMGRFFWRGHERLRCVQLKRFATRERISQKAAKIRMLELISKPTDLTALDWKLEISAEPLNG